MRMYFLASPSFFNRVFLHILTEKNVYWKPAFAYFFFTVQNLHFFKVNREFSYLV